jgi:nitrite reductase/ring-hydroxylating ferredoxin subunit
MIVLHTTTDFDQVVANHPKGHQVILVRAGETVHGYVNRCPHIGVPLDWGDGRCLRAENELQCAMHGALFAADTGFCYAGPCSGRSLQRVAVRVHDGMVVADE